MKYAKRAINEALEQLHETERTFGGRYIKIILLYEDYVKPELLGAVLA